MFEISKVYDIGLQRYRDQKIRVCDKGAITVIYFLHVYLISPYLSDSFRREVIYNWSRFGAPYAVNLGSSLTTDLKLYTVHWMMEGGAPHMMGVGDAPLIGEGVDFTQNTISLLPISAFKFFLSQVVLKSIFLHILQKKYK